MAAIKQLWAPWRLEYVTQEKDTRVAECVLCSKVTEPDADAYVVARGEHVYAILNLFPYNNGHLMVVPKRHVAGFEELTEVESSEAQLFLKQGIYALKAALGAQGFNIGLNLGEAAGAGIAAHLHWHLVPRWQGDTNFMPVLADVRVMPQHLTTTWNAVKNAWPIEANSKEQ